MTQQQQTRITGRDRLFSTTVRPFHDRFDTFDDVREEIRIDLQLAAAGVSDHRWCNLQVERAYVVEKIAGGNGQLLPVRMNVDRLFDRVVIVAAVRRDALL